MTPALLSVQHLGKRHRGVVALDDVSFTAHGGVVAVLGPNGAGKSTLLRCLATVVRPDAGAVHVDGEPVAVADRRTAVRRRLGYLPQEGGFSPGATVFDVVDWCGIVKELDDPRRRHAEVRRVLQAVELEPLAGRRMRELSGGQRQRVGIAQALLGRPGLLVLDEPATGLDPGQRLVLRDLLVAAGEHATVVVSTHLTEEAAAVGRTLLVLDRGRLVYTGTPAGLTATAAGRVWCPPAPPPAGTPGVVRSWRLPDGRARCLGDPPPGADPVEPTLEDAYLLLVSAAAPEPPAAAASAPSLP